MRRIVYTSFVGAANDDAVFTPVRHHGATERATAATGVRHSFLRHNMYADVVPFFAVRDGDHAVIAAPAGDGRTGFVSRDDLAEVAVAVLRCPGDELDGAALEVTGPQALTSAEAAEVITDVTGFSVTADLQEQRSGSSIWSGPHLRR